MTEPRRIKARTPVRLRRKASGVVQSLACDDAQLDAAASTEPPLGLDEIVTRAVEEWQERGSYLPREILSEPAWGILLELLLAEIQGRRVSLLRVCTVSEVPETVANRWLNALERQALVVVRRNALNPQDTTVFLSPRGSFALRRYFAEVVEPHGFRSGPADTARK